LSLDHPNEDHIMELSLGRIQTKSTAVEFSSAQMLARKS
jgi:hypothetical protein